VPGAGFTTWLPLWAKVVVVALAVLACGVIGSRPVDQAAKPATGPAEDAARAIEDLLAPSRTGDPLANLPPDFTLVMGATPIEVSDRDGLRRAVHPTGGCSAPWGDDNTVWDYRIGCSAHDLGYDLLRYAQKKGEPLGPELRERLDDRLKYDMRHQCVVNPRGTAEGCTVVAVLYGFGLDFNSWRQRWGPPGVEPVWPDLGGLAAVCLLLLATGSPLTSPRLARTQIGGYWPEVTDRAAALLRPVLLFVLGGLLIPVLLDAANLPKSGVAVLGRLLALPLVLLGGYLLLMPALALRRRRPAGQAFPGHAVTSVVLGLLYGVLGVLGFVVTGFSGGMGTAMLFGLPVAPLHNLIHLLLGWYLVRASLTGQSAQRQPWLITALACVPPLLPTASGATLLLHVGTIALALGFATVLTLAFDTPRTAPAS
jgi:hypothetical protein